MPEKPCPICGLNYLTTTEEILLGECNECTELLDEGAAGSLYSEQDFDEQVNYFYTELGGEG